MDKIKAVDLKVGDIFAYCGATYEVTYVEPPDRYGIIFLSTIKKVRDMIMSNTFHMARHESEQFILIRQREMN